MLDKSWIYGLSDPRNPDKIMYVGTTSVSLKSRLSQHCCTAVKTRGRSVCASQQWIAGLLRSKVKPSIFPLEECAPADAKQLEAKWIGYFKSQGIVNFAAPGLNETTRGNYYLHEKLKTWRGSLLQKEAASVLGVSFSTYRNWEYGSHAPSFLAMKEIDRILRRPAHELFREMNSPLS